MIRPFSFFHLLIFGLIKLQGIFIEEETWLQQYRIIWLDHLLKLCALAFAICLLAAHAKASGVHTPSHLVPDLEEESRMVRSAGSRDGVVTIMLEGCVDDRIVRG